MTETAILENKDIVRETKRIKSIDRFRGFCVFCMLIFQFLKNFKNLGFLSKLAEHNEANGGIAILPGMTLADIIAPAFIFAIGMTFALSFTKWQRLYGTKMAILHYFERALAIIGVGTFLDVCNKVIDTMGGYEFNVVDWILLSLSIVGLLALVLRLLALIPAWKKKLSFVAEQIFYVTLSCMGIINIVITTIDFFAWWQTGSQIYVYWVTLQGIGFAILVAFPFVKAKTWVKALGATLIFIAFTIFHQYGDNKAWLDVPVHGGTIGGFGWGAMLIFDMMIADLYFKNKQYALISSALFCAVGVFATQWLGEINLGSASPTFLLVGTGLSGLIFCVFDALDRFHKSAFDPFVWWGKNPIIMFLIEFFVIGSYTQFMPDSIVANAAWWLGLIQGVVAICLLTTIAYLLSRAKKSISL